MALADLLFNHGGELRYALQEQAKGMVLEVERAPEEHLLKAEVGEWATALAEKWAAVAPVLLVDEMWQDAAQETQIDVSHDFMRAHPLDGSPTYVSGYRVVVHIPFKGDRAVFNMRASTFGMNPPRANVNDGELTDTLEYPADSPVNIGAHAKALADSVNKYLEWSRADIDQFNAGLEQEARQAIETRRTRVIANHEHVQRTGLPLGRPQQEAPQTYIADAYPQPGGGDGAQPRHVLAHA